MTSFHPEVIVMSIPVLAKPVRKIVLFSLLGYLIVMVMNLEAVHLLTVTFLLKAPVWEVSPLVAF